MRNVANHTAALYLELSVYITEKLTEITICTTITYLCQRVKSLYFQGDNLKNYKLRVTPILILDTCHARNTGPNDDEISLPADVIKMIDSWYLS